MATLNVGKVRPTPKGAYSASAAYAFLDIVSSGGGSYICSNLSGAPAGTAVTNTAYWTLIAQKGDTGATGASPTISIGTVSTGAAGTNASASITGTSPNLKLNLTIPRGNTGAQGPQGATGATGATGPQGPSGVYTGPLKPTADYWKTFIRVPYTTKGRWQLPSGGTWAYVVWNTGGDSAAATVIATSLAAGGTTLTDFYATGTSGFCWRIQ